MRFRKYFDIENSYRKKFLDILAVEKDTCATRRIQKGIL
jgi:hypothetical protein